MKKFFGFLLFGFLFFCSSQVGATWKIDGGIIFNEFGVITECSLEPVLVGTVPDDNFINSEGELIGYCGVNPPPEPEPDPVVLNPVTNLANQVGSGSIDESMNTTNGPIGKLLYFILGIALLNAIIALFIIYKFTPNSF